MPAKPCSLGIPPILPWPSGELGQPQCGLPRSPPRAGRMLGSCSPKASPAQPGADMAIPRGAALSPPGISLCATRHTTAHHTVSRHVTSRRTTQGRGCPSARPSAATAPRSTRTPTGAAAPCPCPLHHGGCAHAQGWSYCHTQWQMQFQPPRPRDPSSAVGPVFWGWIPH